MRNEVFRAMFSHNFREATKGTATLKEFDYDIIFNFIKFLYTDECDITENNAVSLLACCHHYREKVLQNRCESFIATGITISNACTIYQYACQYNCPNLKDQCIHYVKYRYDRVAATSEFKSLSNEDKQLFLNNKQQGLYEDEENDKKDRSIFAKLFHS